MSPRLRTRSMLARRHDLELLTEEQRAFLLRGRSFFEPAFENADELCLSWTIHRDRLLPEYIAKYPGQRPFAWWFCDHGHERPIIRQWLTPEGIARERAKKFGFLSTATCPPFQEPGPDYLQRLGLLAPDEITHVEAKRAAGREMALKIAALPPAAEPRRIKRSPDY